MQKRHRLPYGRGSVYGFEGEALFSPGIESSQEGADVDDSFAEQLQRRTGAGGFVWSSAVEDDFAITGDFLVTDLDFFQGHPDCSG
jgi:hypothetical protein